jgi:hypothetical protein
MPEDVITAENVAAPEPIAPVEPSSFAEVMNSWTPEERSHWDKTGEEPKPKEVTATPPPEPDTPQEPLPQPAEVKPEQGPGEEEDHEPEYYGTPEQQRKQRQAFARKTRQNAELKAELKLLREQYASKPAETAPAPKAEVKAPTTALQRPKPPKMTGHETAEEWDAKNEAYSEALADYFEQVAESKLQAFRATSEADRETAKFEARVEARNIKSAPYFSEDFPASLAMNHVIRYDPDGLDYVPNLTKEAGERIKALTDIPNFDKLLVENRDRALYLLGEKRATAKFEMQKLIKPPAAPAPNPKPITVTAAPAPGTRISANTSASGDPLKEAYAAYDRTGDHRYLTEAMRLENERELAALRR